MSFTKTLIKYPSAWIPIVMSLAALSLVIGHLVMFGAQRSEDEGTAAHIFQFLMGGQLPIIAYFAIRWLPRKPKQVIQILALQLIAGLLAFAPVFIFEL